MQTHYCGNNVGSYVMKESNIENVGNPPKTIRQTFAYLIETLRPFKMSVAVMAIVSIYSGLALSLMPYLIRTMINRVSEQPSGDLFVILAWPMGLYLLTQ